ncbi:EF-hand domain-containing protein [Viridibacterium curvum]|uniref:EF-hand domain-containing protein n=1 Tax=Viridibacterium curvum TaxID=1101404 RepID=A0ABP9QTM0_9RHOO
MNVSSVGSSGMMPPPPPRGGQRPDAAKMAEDLFSQIDTKGQGYIEKADLQSAVDGTGDSSSVDELFSQLDGDSDGKVTQSEMQSAFESLSQALDSQAMGMRMQQGGMPPPPPPGDDKGFSKDELTSMASEVSSTDSKRSEFMQKIADNFDEADADGDGKVTAKEAMAWEQSQQASSATSASTSGNANSEVTDTASTAASSTESQARMFRQLMQLMQAYGQPESGNSSTASALSVTA